MSEFAEKAKSIGVSLRRGSKKVKRVRNEQDGSHAGLEIEHWDDHQDAIVRPKMVDVKIKSSLKEE